MCKFTNRLFVFSLLALVTIAGSASIAGAPASQRQDISPLLELLAAQEDNYDLHYDQRQKGSENLRLKLDGFFIGLPAQETTGLMVFTDDLLENLGEDLLLGLSKSRSSNKVPSNFLAYKVDNSVNKFSAESKLPETIIVEIPAPKKDLFGEQRDNRAAADEAGDSSRTKFHIYHLLNLLRKTTGNHPTAIHFP